MALRPPRRAAKRTASRAAAIRPAGTGEVVATYVVEKGKPLAEPVK